MIESSVKRLGFRFSQAAKSEYRSFKVYQEDLNALKDVANYIQQKQEETIINQQLFAKLYVFVFGEFIKNYNTTVFSEIPQKELHKILNTSLDELILKLTEKLNDSERYMFFNDSGVEGFGENHPITISIKKSKEDSNKTIKQMKKEGKERFFGEVWKKEDVSDNIISMINKAIQVYTV